MLAQCQMVWMLLSMSVGWTLGSTTAHPIKDRVQLGITVGVAFSHICLVLWEQSYDESSYTYHVHESLPGLLLILFRVGLAALFGYNLKQTIAKERSVLRKDFYQSFAIVSQQVVVSVTKISPICFFFHTLHSNLLFLFLSLSHAPHALPHSLPFPFHSLPLRRVATSGSWPSRSSWW